MHGRNERLVDLDMRWHADTPKGFLASLDGVQHHAVWLPLSQIEVEWKDAVNVTVTLPEWLAIEKELV